MSQASTWAQHFLDLENRVVEGFLDVELDEEGYAERYASYRRLFDADDVPRPFSVRDAAVLRDPDSVQEYRSYFRARTLFYVAHHPAATFGAELNDIDPETVWSFVVNANQVNGMPERTFGMRFVVAQRARHDEPRIIYHELFMQGAWSRPHGHPPAFVNGLDAATEVEKLVEPEDPASRTLYDAL